MFQKLFKLIEGARTSSWGLRKLNFALGLTIPFNKPHGIVIQSISDNEVTTFIPYKRKNLNHIGGVHACGLATVAEFASGILILSRVDPTKYRIIMQTLQVDYSYQAKSDCTAHFSISEEDLNNAILTPLTSNDAVMYTATIILRDNQGTEVAQAQTTWQIKRWDKVKTKV